MKHKSITQNFLKLYFFHFTCPITAMTMFKIPCKVEIIVCDLFLPAISQLKKWHFIWTHTYSNFSIVSVFLFANLFHASLLFVQSCKFELNIEIACYIYSIESVPQIVQLYTYFSQDRKR